MAEMNDPPLSIIEFNKGFDKYSDWLKCEHDICGFNSCKEMDLFEYKVVEDRFTWPAKLVNGCKLLN